jgi:hypothetical protein
MTYSLISDVRREFKSLADNGQVITDAKIVEFQLQMQALIDAYIGTKYALPIAGTSPVNQQDTVSFTTAAGAGEPKTVKTTASGMTKTYTYTTVGADTDTVIRDAVLGLINADGNRIVDAVASGTGDIVLQSSVLGFAYVLAIAGTGVSAVNNTVAVLGSSALRLLRKIETELTACKIASILKTKVAEKLNASGVRQDIKDESCGKQALAVLKDIQDGKAELESAELGNEGGGIESSSYAGTFCIDKQQW